MGSGVCSRRHRKIFQSLLVVTVVCGMLYGGMVSYEMHKQLRRTETVALKYQQHQESLSAQLQVVYEHRSRLEKSLQKERLEHKKAKEDYMAYKLDSQQSLNKAKQESISRYNSLQVQHQMLKKQHDDLKMQYSELQDQHEVEGDDHSRLLVEHKDRYEKLEQFKQAEITELRNNIFALREENKQLRKAHYDIHSQLQDEQVNHQSLKVAHNQLTLTLEDHKSALAAAQVQMNEYNKLKEQPAAPESHVQVEQMAKVDVPPKVEFEHVVDSQDDQGMMPMQLDNQMEEVDDELQHIISDNMGEAEGKRELAEEGMAVVEEPQKPAMEPAPPPQDNKPEVPVENAAAQEKPQQQPKGPQPELHPEAQLQHEANAPLEHVKSAYEQQQEQQRLEAQRAVELRQIQTRQEALRAHRERVLREREQKLKEELERELQQNMVADRREQLLREEQEKKKSEYENMDNDIVQGEEDHHADDEEGDVHMLDEEMEKQEVGDVHQGAVGGELDPEDDPNNQGEDEFEEAEDEQSQHRVPEEEEEMVDEEEEPATPAKQSDTQLGPGQPAVDEELVVAGNPDQQEDALDDQYQEEDEAQEDIVGGQKRAEEGEEEGEDQYNEENLEQDDIKNQEGPRLEGDLKEAENNEEDNYDEEEEEGEEHAEGQDNGANQRAEM